MRNGAAAEDLPELIGATRPGLADDVHGLRGDLAGVRPLEQEVRDGLVEGLIRSLRRTEDVVIDLPSCHRVEDEAAGLGITPTVKLDDQSALRPGVERTRPLEQVRPAL